MKNAVDKLKELFEQATNNDIENANLEYTNESVDLAEVSTRIVHNANLHFQGMRKKYIDQMAQQEEILEEYINHETITVGEANQKMTEYQVTLKNSLLN